MNAIKFHATIKDGAIAIPTEHLAMLSGEVTVIVVPNRSRVVVPNLIDELLANPVRVEGFLPLTREETHERSNSH